MAENAIVGNRYRLVVIGGSAGSLEVILELISSLPSSFPLPVVLVVHRKRDSGDMLAELLSARARLRVKEAEEKEVLAGSIVYVAPPDYHLLIEKDGSIALDGSERVNFSRPSIDVTFASASQAYGAALIGIILSGANADGAEGLKIIEEHGGLAIVQNPASAVVPFMPQQAARKIKTGAVYSTARIRELLNSLGR